MIFTISNTIGADVSFHQDLDSTPQQIDFLAMKRQGASFVIIRAGQNLWSDPDFSINWRNARSVGLPRGTYWFYDSRTDPLTQAELFALCVRDDPPELEMWVDVEERYSGAWEGYRNWKTFINRLRQLMPDARIGLYTNYYYITGKIPSTEFSFFSQFPLWLAWYTKDEGGNYAPKPASVKVPSPWLYCSYWQWGTPSWGLSWGCESQEIDMNLYNGTLDTFKASYGLENGETPVSYHLVKPNISGEFRTIRKLANPNILGMKIGQVNAGSSGKCSVGDEHVYSADVYVDGVLKAKAGDKWLHVFEANGSAIDGWIAQIHLGITYLTVETIAPPAPTEPTVTHIIKVYSDGKISIDDGIPF